MNEEDAIRDFLGDRPGAEQLREWRSTLERRLEMLQQDLERPGSGPSTESKIAGKIKELKRQIEALREEEAVTRFVEDSVRVTLAMGTVSEPMDEYEG